MSGPAKTRKPKTFQLPSHLAGSAELARLIRELESLDDFLYQSQIRVPGSGVTPPKSSRLLDDLAATNHYSILNAGHRRKLLDGLKKLEKKAPVIHISFAVEPSGRFIEKIVSWMRENLHKYVLLEIGLQPGIAVGCVVRTDNKIFDMSLRHRFSEYQATLIEKLAENPPEPKHSLEPVSAEPELDTEQPTGVKNE